MFSVYTLLYISIFQYTASDDRYIYKIEKRKEMSINDIIRNGKKSERNPTPIYENDFFLLL